MTFYLDHRYGRSVGPTRVGSFRRVRKIAKSSYYVISVRPSVRMDRTRLPVDGFSLNLLSEGAFFLNLSRKFDFNLNLAGIMGTLSENIVTFTIESR